MTTSTDRDIDTPPDPFALLEGACAARTAPDRSEVAVLSALRAAPNDRAVRMAAYKFYFYNSRYGEALPHAAWCIADGARALGLAEDWRRLEPGSVSCAGFEAAPRFLVQSLVAWAYCRARSGDLDQGLEALAKAAEIDPADTFGARRLAEVVAHGTSEED